jgi:hypothetical protein
LKDRKLYDRLTPLKLREAVPWDNISQVVVVFNDGYGNIQTVASDAAFNGPFLELAEIHLNNARVYTGLGKTSDES